jgi:hypothetical protein
MRDIYRTIAGAFGFLIVAMQYVLSVDGESGAALAASSLNFFSFFTILTNLLASAALLVPAVAPNSAAGRFLMRPAVRTAITGYIVIVGVVYYVLLQGLGPRQGLALYLEYVLHYVTPPLFVLDWLLFVPRGETVWKVGFESLGYPAAYLVWTLVHGAATGWYPYPFVDVSELGYPRMLLNSAGLVLAFLALELSLVALDRALWRFGQRAAIT